MQQNTQAKAISKQIPILRERLSREPNRLSCSIKSFYMESRSFINTTTKNPTLIPSVTPIYYFFSFITFVNFDITHLHPPLDLFYYGSTALCWAVAGFSLS
jgi:hypothetical protein